MATKYKTNKRKISSLVKQQVPQFVLEDHPKFTEFLSSYYLFMESAELNLDTITDIDQILLEPVIVSPVIQALFAEMNSLSLASVSSARTVEVAPDVEPVIVSFF